MENITISGSKREYMVNLLKRYSVIALICGVLTLALAFYAVTAGVINTIIVKNHANGFFSFIYFTMLSNTLAALCMAFVIPFAVEGIRKNRFTLPGWTAVAHYMAATSISVTMVFVVAFMSWVKPEDAFGGANIFTHVICPILILVAFFQTENGYIYKRKDRLIACIPFSLYMTVYFIEVVLIGEDNGGWPDIYHIMDYAPPLVAIFILLILAFGLSSIIAAISNRLTKKRQKAMFKNWKDDADPIEIRIEAYGLGTAAGQTGERNNMVIPLDILAYLAKKYDLELDDLMKPFMKGFLESLKEREFEVGENKK